MGYLIFLHRLLFTLYYLTYFLSSSYFKTITYWVKKNPNFSLFFEHKIKKGDLFFLFSEKHQYIMRKIQLNTLESDFVW